ncbi:MULTISPECIES: hypothetical protein [unclassified Ruegeria]|uniref:hypothetical protein n=1 Tax=unclassified Ruegeria TaxID=2625375 RepID=UPI001490DBAD|nr:MULTISPECIES: hypothetical protein [unclassified Ruegeria]NOC46558.1 hypothetical protein [Ruegeria sp. HKCCD7559]NOD85439.1 hypothetical protein [Ruegeria sp. HKCCD6119]
MTISLAVQIHDHLQDVADMTGVEVTRMDDACVPGGNGETDRKAGVSYIFAAKVGMGKVFERLGSDKRKRFAQEQT